MTLLDVLPSLKGVTVARSFDPSKWQLPIHSHGTDIHVGDLSLRDEARRRKVAFYLDVDGMPVCQSMCPESMWFPALVTRITATQIVADRAVLHVDAMVPLHRSITDLAFPGSSLTGARMADVTIVDLSGHRRTVHTELPAHVAPTTPVILALRAVEADARPSSRQTQTSSAGQRP